MEGREVPPRGALIRTTHMKRRVDASWSPTPTTGDATLEASKWRTRRIWNACQDQMIKQHSAMRLWCCNDGAGLCVPQFFGHHWVLIKQHHSIPCAFGSDALGIWSSFCVLFPIDQAWRSKKNRLHACCVIMFQAML